MIDLGDARYKFHFGPYRAPRFRIGATVFDEIRGNVEIVGISTGRIPWPIGKTKRAKQLVIFRDLATATRHESAVAICHWWGVTGQTVSKWRKGLHFVGETVGQAKLRSAYASHP